MMLDNLTRQAISHTAHCLVGCGIGEVFGMVLGQSLNNATQTFLAVALAFVFGYALTFLGVHKKMTASEAFRLALAVDTVSIISMEIIDNTLEWLIPGAINARLNQVLFWWSLALSLLVAFLLTVPVNRLVMAKGIGRDHQH